ncbi:hypothetical protein J1614_005469 [Plenodomus biglobosus]|nr:hypothetical protein J1614_005469 [Plenodomus biglobosus]
MGSFKLWYSTLVEDAVQKNTLPYLRVAHYLSSTELHLDPTTIRDRLRYTTLHKSISQIETLTSLKGPAMALLEGDKHIFWHKAECYKGINQLQILTTAGHESSPGAIVDALM